MGAFFCIIALLNTFDLHTYAFMDDREAVCYTSNMARNRNGYAYSRALATETVKSLVCPSDPSRTFRLDIYVPMLAWTILQLRLGFEAAYGERNSRDVLGDAYWSEPMTRGVFHRQLDVVLLNDSDVNDEYQRLLRDHREPTTFFQESLDVSGDGYTVLSLEPDVEEQRTFFDFDDLGHSAVY